jgi:hypothetical protein
MSRDMPAFLAAAALAACLALAGCAPGDRLRSSNSSSPYCDDYARMNSRLYGVHYSIAAHLDEEAALRAYCMRMLNGP